MNQYRVGEEYAFVKVISKDQNSSRHQCGYNLYSNLGEVKALSISLLKCVKKDMVPKAGSIHRHIPGSLFTDPNGNVWYHADQDANASSDNSKMFQCFSIYTTHDVDHGHNHLLGHVRMYEKTLYLEELERALTVASDEVHQKALNRIVQFIKESKCGEGPQLSYIPS